MLGRAERSLVQELRDWRNKWAHQKPFSSDDADRALDSSARLLTALSAPQADEVGKMKLELRRLEASWRPATSDEGFEIVRRRLFEPLDGPAAFTQRDLTARAFGDLYRAQSAELPPECNRRRIAASKTDG